MIVCTIAFGKHYIDQFFDTCLYSLMTRNNLRSIPESQPFLTIATLKGDADYVQQRLRERNIVEFFGTRVDVIWTEIGDTEEQCADILQNHGDQVAYHLLMRLIQYCLERDEIFLFTASDTLYADGTVNAAWKYHGLTGRIVGIFAARLEEQPGGPAFYRSVLDQPNGVRDIFVRHVSPDPGSLVSHYGTVNPDARMGAQIVLDDRSISVFATVTNPFIGRFTPEDCALFAEYGRFGAWDTIWSPYLHRQNRLFVLTNLDLGMAMEFVPKAHVARSLENYRKTADLRSERLDRYLYQRLDDGDAKAAARAARFSDPMNMFCYSSRL